MVTKRIMNALLSGTVALLLLSQASLGQTENPNGFGRIEGRIRDKDGSPVPRMKVMVQSASCNFIGAVPTAISDDNGIFALEDVPAGTVLLATSKDVDFYPNTLYAPFIVDVADTQALPRVFVVANQTTSGVVITLREKGWKLDGSVVDSSTGKPVRDVSIKIIRRDNPDLFLSTTVNGEFKFILPSKVFDLEVSAPGYESWSTSIPTQPANKDGLIAPPGQQLTLTVSLVRVSAR